VGVLEEHTKLFSDLRKAGKGRSGARRDWREEGEDGRK
jgi:hypothetical protein